MLIPLPFVTTTPAVEKNLLVVLDLQSLKPEAEVTLQSRRFAWDELQAASALQGLANRKAPRLYLRFVGQNAKLDTYWLKRLQSTWMRGWKEGEISDLSQALHGFRDVVKGVVVWDERVPATSNVASTIAGVENLLPVRYDPSPSSLYTRLTQDPSGPRLAIRKRLIAPNGEPMFTGRGTIAETSLASSGSAKCDAYLWAAEKYLRKGGCVPGLLGYYPDAFWLQKPRDVPLERTLLTNHDYIVAQRGFVLDLGPWDDEAPDDDLQQTPGTDGRTLQAILRKAYDLNGGRMTHVAGFTPWDQKYTDHTGRKRGGVETEWRYAEILSCFNAFMDADAAGLHAMANASVFSHEPLQARYPQPNLPTRETLRQKGYLLADGSIAPKHYATIYVGDYDSAAWLYTRMPEIWDDPARGSVPLGWAFNPTIQERFPTGLTFARATATANDFFISGDSGAGYLNPGYLQPPRKWSGLPSGLAEWERFSGPLFKRWDLGITGFVIDGYAPGMDERTKQAYARFSPKGVVAQKIPYLSDVDGTPFLQMSRDLPGGNTEGAAKILVEALPKEAVSFSIFRTILWSPTDHKKLFDRVKEIQPDVEFVDPYTLMLLASLRNAKSRP